LSNEPRPPRERKPLWNVNLSAGVPSAGGARSCTEWFLITGGTLLVVAVIYAVIKLA
jgi:hypothetical protein